MANDRLNDHSNKRRNYPEEGKLFNVGSKRTEYAAGVTILQGKSKLYSHKAEAHGKYLRNGKSRLRN